MFPRHKPGRPIRELLHNCHLINEVCDLSPSGVFTPNAPEHVAVSPDGEVKAWVRWAEDQSGCQPKIDWPVSTICAFSFLAIELNCDFRLNEDHGYYGGGFVTDSQWGCLELGIVKDRRD